MIEKPTIIVTSLGRTGTLFFSTLFGNIIPDGTSLHEPDYFNFGQYRGVKKKVVEAVRQISESGFRNLVVRKLLGKWNVRAISDARIRGALSRADTINKIIDQREQFISSKSGNTYIESSSAFYGVIDVLPDVFAEHRLIYLVRDGRDWVRSMINFTAAVMYSKNQLRTWISPDWPTAVDLDDEPFASRWHEMSVFEKLCWAWARLNQYAIDSVHKNPDARVFRFEDVFQGQDRYRHLEDLVTFATLSGNRDVGELNLEGRLEKRVHRSNNDFPRWVDWSTGQKHQYRKICGTLMERLEYKLD